MKSKQSDMLVVIEDDLTGQQALSMVEEMNKVSVHRIDRIILSLGKVKRIDATGVAILVRLYSQLIAKGKQLLLTQLTLPVRTTLEEIGFLGILESIPAVEPLSTPSWRLLASPAGSKN